METQISLAALIVPEISANLFVNQLTRKGMKVIFVENYAIIKHDSLHLTMDKIGKIYRIDFRLVNKDNNDEAMKTCNEGDITLWHRRMGHLNRRRLRLMNLPCSDNACDECMRGKTTRLPFVKCQLPRSTRIGELIHTDLTNSFGTYYWHLIRFTVVSRWKFQGGR
jgi:hypothetical protein